MYLDHPPACLETQVFSRMPERFWRGTGGSAWGAVNKPGQRVESFIEGPAFDATGNLYVVDIPYGRIFRIDAAGNWTLAIEYDGEPNGMKPLADGRFVVADYRRGLMLFDPGAGTIEPLLARRNSQSFKGVNDVTIASNGDIYFTDQGQTGLHDPSGCVYRLAPDGRLDCLMDNLPSPNGLVLDVTEQVLFVAMTRDNAVWRAPLLNDGSVAKVGRFCSLFGISGPDGLAMDRKGNLFVAHASLGSVFAYAPDGQCIARIRSCAGPTCTNLAFGGAEGRHLYVTESSSGTVLVAQWHAPGISLPR